MPPGRRRARVPEREQAEGTEGRKNRGPEPRDAERISGELHALLGRAGIEGPYVLVGHSFGGLYAQTYATRYAEEVAGVCLVESSSPEQFGHRSEARDGHEPPTRTFAVASLLARIGVVRLCCTSSFPRPPICRPGSARTSTR